MLGRSFNASSFRTKNLSNHVILPLDSVSNHIISRFGGNDGGLKMDFAKQQQPQAFGSGDRRPPCPTVLVRSITMRQKIFVYGTLKTGFPNFHINRGIRVPGRFVTVQKLPLYLVGPSQVPWLVNRPGDGEFVVGEVFEVDAHTMACMDVLEQIGQLLWYTREPLMVRALADPTSQPMPVQVYFGSAERLAIDTIHAGPLAEYTPTHAMHYRRDAT
jgi:gamma-glutamylaminecyclotransferase